MKIRSKAIILTLAISLIGCATPNTEETVPNELQNSEAVISVNPPDTNPLTPAEPRELTAEENPSIADLTVEAPEPTPTPTAAVPPELDPDTPNLVIGQETPVGDQPVMNPAGETLIKTAQVTFPDGRERLEVGEDYQIRWESEGIKAFEIEVHQFGRRTALLAERALAIEGLYNWTPQAELLRGNDFAQLTIVLKDADTGIVHDESDSAFILVSGE